MAAFRGRQYVGLPSVPASQLTRTDPQMPQIWTYMYTTMQDSPDINNAAQNDFKAPMAGFGYGLPLSRLVSAIL